MASLRNLLPVLIACAALALASGSAAQPGGAWSKAHEVARAVQAAVASDKAGAPPEAALRPVRALSADPPPASKLAPGLDFNPPSPRVSAYRDLTGMGVHAAPEARPSAALTAAALADWESELIRLRSHPSMLEEPLLLAERYAEAGDLAGARRAADLDLRPGPLARIEALIAARAWDEAAAAVLSARGKVDAGALDELRESLIGAAFARGGRDTGQRIMRRLNVDI